MNIIIAYINAALAVLTFIFFLASYYRSEVIFIKARARDVREILSYDIVKYERITKVKLGFKIFLSVIFMVWNIARVISGCIYLSKFDMYMWLTAILVLSVISCIDFWSASPLQQNN